MTKISSQVVAHSLSPQGDELLSVLVTYPRIIHSEVMTHRMLSKNSASSRAIPFEKMLKSVQENPFIPIAWQKDHKGMQGTEYFTEAEAYWNKDKWLKARDFAVKQAKILSKDNVTKQLCNRLLEPFMWHTVLVTGNVNKEGWLNFFDLRCPDYQFNDGTGKIHHFKSKKDAIKAMPDLNKFGIYSKPMSDLDWLLSNKGMAEIHMMALAEAIFDSWKESTPKQLQAGEWHIPFEDKMDIDDIYYNSVKSIFPSSEYSHGEKDYLFDEARVKVSTAMCARTSYTVVGDEKEFGYDKQIALHDRMINQVPLHASPMEHCARAMNQVEWESWTKGSINPGLDMPDSTAGWCRNFKGFIQYREILENSEEM